MNEEFAALQPAVFRQLKNTLKHQRLSHAYLFEGDAGTGKRAAAQWLAQAFLCLDPQPDGSPCGVCANCRRIAAGEHPDVQTVAPSGLSIKVEQIRQVKRELSKAGMESAKKVIVIESCDKMSASAANSLLKFIEEPLFEVLIVFETDHLAQVLPTIRSRCQILHFLPLAPAKLEARLVNEDVSPEAARVLAHLGVSFAAAVELSKQEWFNEARNVVPHWVKLLEKNDPQAFVYVQEKLVKLFSDRPSQEIALDLVLYALGQVFSASLTGGKAQIAKANEQRLCILNAKNKLAANVNFQGILEQAAIEILTDHK